MKLKERIFRWWQNRAAVDTEETIEVPVIKENIFLPHIRNILEQVLEQRNLNYGKMKLILIDSDTEPESFLEEDKVEACLKELSKDLNYLQILTERPAYFQRYVETMYEETGLLVCVREKRYAEKYEGNTVLDFEQKGHMCDLKLQEPGIYIPIYKKKWEIGENLDILVPIGYNTVIAKGISVEE